MRIGVDIGGTFTDVVAVTDGEVSVVKTPSTPEAPEEGVTTGGERIAERAGTDLDAATFLAHGTTVATNAVLERSWADTALLTTQGFRDALEIGRQARPDLYDFQSEKPAPIVERDHRYDVPERLDERGEAVEELDEDAVRDIAARLRAGGVESVAVSFLFSFENDVHEERTAEILREELDIPVTTSGRVLPEIREYERTLVTALNAALKPVMTRYIGRLETKLDRLGVPAKLRVMQSNGGIISAEVAQDRPVRTLLSGPAAGVQGAAYIAELAGHDDVMTMDMGGTSCDVSLVLSGDPAHSTEVTVGDYPVSVPMVDIHTIGSGGGSIGWIDEGGALRVGPESAGADPGPICYGRGGTRPTVTDAHLLLNRLNPSTFGQGFDVPLDAARDGMADCLAEPLGLGVHDAAQGLLEVANAKMERALRVMSVERGHDPRAFTLVAFGGAGPLHACTLAAELDIPQVLVPRAAGVLSALGLLSSDVVYDYGTSRIRRWEDVDPDDLADQYAAFKADAEEQLGAEGFQPPRRRYDRAVDLRYVGQSFDLTVSVPGGELTTSSLAAIEDRFHERHADRYGHASPDEPVELVTVRLSARGLVEAPALRSPSTDGPVEAAITEERQVWFDGDTYGTRVFDRAALPAGATVEGPAVVEGGESTVVIRPEQSMEVDSYGNLRVEI